MANVGDIKPAEYNISFFLDLAWNVDRVKHGNVFSHEEECYGKIFGSGLGKKCADLKRDYYQINFERKPESMGWGEEYASVKWPERVEDTQYSFVNYREAQRRLKSFADLSERAKALVDVFICCTAIASLI